MSRKPMPDVVVLLPGITGSVLEKDGDVVWGFGARSLGTALFTRGRSLRDALMLRDDSPEVDDTGDGVVATGLMPDLHLIPRVWKIDGYGKVAETIKSGFDVTEGRNYFEFPYDWRRSNVVSARKLARSAHDWLARWRETSNPDAELVLIAHSMGGLVARHFLEVMEGWRETRALITFGTPYRGSLNAVDALVNGVRKGPSGLLDLTELSRSFTALHELLPIYESYDAGDGQLVRVGETRDIPNLDPDRAAAALRFHRDIEAAVESNLQRDEYREGRYELYPVVGITQPTNQSARRDGQGVELLKEYRGEDISGDGTVPRVSAVPIEYSDENVGMFASTKHGSLQNAAAVLTHLEGVLTGRHLDLGSFREEPTAARVSLEIEDLLEADDPVRIRARPTRPDLTLSAEVTDASTGQEVASVPLSPDADRWHEAELDPLPAGAYRVRISGERVLPAEDSFAVGVA